MKRAVYVVSVLFFLHASYLQAGLFGGLTKSGTTTAQFLKIQVGARAIGMGGAYVAAVNDLSALYWNPAGLVKVGRRGGVNFVHTNWLADTRFDFAGVAIHAGGVGTFALSFTSLSMPDMKVRTEFEPEGTGEFFSAIDLALGVSYARQLTDRFSVGFNAKYVRQQIWHMTAATVAFDFGLLFRTDLDWLTLGVSVSNFGPKMQYTGKDAFVNYDFNPDEFGDNANIFANLQTDRWDLPLLFRFGLAADVYKDSYNHLVAAVEARHPNDNTESISTGLEYGFRERFFLRAGYQAIFEDKSERGLTAGVGFIYYLTTEIPFVLDYAYADWGRLSNVHRFSLEIRF